jgi:proton glutamate symport protein
VAGIRLAILSGALVAFHVPLEGAAAPLGADADFDMARTAIGVIRDYLACAVVARPEGIKATGNVA